MCVAVCVAVCVEVCVADLTDNRALHLRRSVTFHLESYTCVPNSILYITNSIILHTNIFITEPCISQICHVSPRVMCVSRTRIMHVTNSIICATNSIILQNIFPNSPRLTCCHMGVTNLYHICHNFCYICHELYHRAHYLRRPATSHLLSVRSLSRNRIMCVTNSVFCPTNSIISADPPHASSVVICVSRTLIIWSVYLCRSTTRLIYCHMRHTNSYHMCHELLSFCHCVSADPLRLTCCHVCVTDSYYVCHELYYLCHELYHPPHYLCKSTMPYLLLYVCYILYYLCVCVSSSSGVCVCVDVVA